MGEKCRDHEEIFDVITKLSEKYSLNFARQDHYTTCAINKKLIHIFSNHTINKIDMYFGLALKYGTRIDV